MKPSLPDMPRPYAGKTLDLTADQRAVVQRELKARGDGLSTLFSQLSAKAGPLDLELAYNILSVDASRLSTICQTLSISLEHTQEREAQRKLMRELNMRIQELEQELGRSGTVEQTGAHLEYLGKLVEKWWEDQGLGYVRDLHFSSRGHATVVFSCSLHGATMFRSTSDTPISDAAAEVLWRKSLRDRGFDVHEPPDDRDPWLCDNDNNRRLLERLFAQTFPRSKVIRTENHYNRQNVPVLRQVEVMLYEISAIAALDKKASASDASKLNAFFVDLEGNQYDHATFVSDHLPDVRLTVRIVDGDPSKIEVTPPPGSQIDPEVLLACADNVALVDYFEVDDVPVVLNYDGGNPVMAYSFDDLRIIQAPKV